MVVLCGSAISSGSLEVHLISSLDEEEILCIIPCPVSFNVALCTAIETSIPSLLCFSKT